MKYLHKFETPMEFIDAYGGVFETPSGYTEPWVSLSPAGFGSITPTVVSYNKVLAIDTTELGGEERQIEINNGKTEIGEATIGHELRWLES